jgi:hypothetical protein
LEVPGNLAATLAPPGQDPARAALEALVLEAYRERRLTGYQIRKLLGIPSRDDLDGSQSLRRISPVSGNCGRSKKLGTRRDCHCRYH